MSIPEFFRCPISLDMFSDPVTLSTGQTFDRASIERWFAGGNLTCPVTMQKLQDTALVPNHTLRLLINQWLVEDTKSLGSQSSNSASVCGTMVSLTTLKQHLESKHTSNATKFKILNKVRVLSSESDFGRASLIQLGFFQVLLLMMFRIPLLLDFELIEVGLDCILSLSPSTHFESLNILKGQSYLNSMILLIEWSNSKIKTSLCHLIEAVASSSETRELCKLLGQQQRLWQVLVPLVKGNFTNCASEAAVRAISGLCYEESNRENAVRHDVLDGLISYLSNSNTKNSLQALMTLELLLQLESGKTEFNKNREAIKVLVKMVFRVSIVNDHKGSEHAVSSLLIVCMNSAKIRVEAVNSGVLSQLLLLLQSQCSSIAKCKARTLLKLLRSMWTEDSSRETSHCRALVA